MRVLFFLTPCAIAGYFAYPYLNSEKTEAEQPKVTFVLLNDVAKDEIVGSWVLSPRSISLLSPDIGASGRRVGLSLESWGGGHAYFIAGEHKINGPIAWHTKTGVGDSPATLHISSNDGQLTLRFTELDDRLVLIAEAESLVPGEKDHLRFFKAS